nr:hypothetical protein [uncultured archaeon]
MISPYMLFPSLYLITLIILITALFFGIKKKSKILFFIVGIIVTIGIVNWGFIIHTSKLSYEWYVLGKGMPPDYCDSVPCNQFLVN